jgi:hypothetical protein
MPGTRYVLTGRFRIEGHAPVRMTVQGRTLEDVTSGAAEKSWTDFRHAFTTDRKTPWLGRITVARAGEGKVWLDGLTLRESRGGPNLLWEADVNRPVLGRYNPVDCFMLDQLLDAAERSGIYLQLCMLTRDLYMDRLKDEASPEYGAAIDDAKRFFRYAVARWGYSTSVAAWEYWNEMDPGLPTDRFYGELGQYLEAIDIYGHLRKTSTWGPSVKDARHPELDVADVHFYLRPTERERLADEVDAVLDRTAFLRRHRPTGPVLIGEFGLATNQWRLSPSMEDDRRLVHFHNSLWASALSGASGTTLFWWWDQLDRMDAYRHYRPLATFLDDIPFASAGLNQSDAILSGQRARLIGLQGPECAYFWLFNPEAAWTRVADRKTPLEEIRGITVAINGLRPGSYRIEWWDTDEGTVIERARAASPDGKLRVSAPAFADDTACKVLRVNN